MIRSLALVALCISGLAVAPTGLVDARGWKLDPDDRGYDNGWQAGWQAGFQELGRLPPEAPIKPMLRLPRAGDRRLQFLRGYADGFRRAMKYKENRQ